MHSPDIDPQLQQTLLEVIQAHPNGVAEHSLLKQLSQAGYDTFTPSLDPLELFQAHFLLFHILYRLADIWRQAGHGDLVINCLNIYFQASASSTSGADLNQQALKTDDSLKRYYLDYQQYRDTQMQDVIDLLDGFWKKLGGLAWAQDDEIQAAKQTLNLPLDDTPTLIQINHQYRKLCFIHHPDRGGNTADFQKINQSAELLKRLYTN